MKFIDAEKRTCSRCYEGRSFGIVFDEFEGDPFICSFCVYNRLTEYTGMLGPWTNRPVLKKESDYDGMDTTGRRTPD